MKRRLALWLYARAVKLEPAIAAATELIIEQRAALLADQIVAQHQNNGRYFISSN